MERKNYKALIRKYLRGECNAAELRAINNLLKQADAPSLIDIVWKEEWTNFEEADISDSEIQRWKDRFENKHLQRTAASQPRRHPGRKRLFSLPYAAVWAGLLVLGTWYTIRTVRQKEQTALLVVAENAIGKRSKIRLTDSSIVYLGAASKLSFPKQFADSARVVYLEGEAFFEIAKNIDQPFIVHSGEIQTKVLGTSFAVSAIAGLPLSVSVATGKVQVNKSQADKETALAVLTPGQKVIWQNDRATVLSIGSEEVTAWKDGILTFDNATLREIAGALERQYGVRIHFSQEGTAKRALTISFSVRTPLTEVMDVLAATANFTYRIQNKQFIIN